MAAPAGSMAAAVADTPDLMPVAVLLDELKHEDMQVRLTSIRQLSTIGELMQGRNAAGVTKRFFVYRIAASLRAFAGSALGMPGNGALTAAV